MYELAYIFCWSHVMDVIKPNESELAIIDLEIQPIIAFNLILILLFWASLMVISGTVCLLLMGFSVW